jgi:hypothetical protein
MTPARHAVTVLLAVLAGLVVVLGVCQAQQPNSKSKSSTPAPSLGFSKIKDVSPITDSDALTEENELKKKLPGNEFVGAKRALHEGGLMHDFLDDFRGAKECEGITFYLKKATVPDYAVQITVNNHDKPGAEQEWIWMLFDTKKKELGGLGNQSSSKLTARDVCMTVWENVDPNHYKKPGGKIE